MNHPLVHSAQGIVSLIDLARRESGLAVGASAGGMEYESEVGRASDVILVHGNGATEQTYYNMIKRVRADGLNKPILCNEDSPRFTQLKVAMDTHTSWGYYNTHTKQDPPCDWGVTKGEDTFFAWRLADSLGLPTPSLPEEDRFYLQGLEEDMVYENKRWIRLASLWPERIDKVKFYRNGELMDIAYEEPYYVNHVQTWIQEGTELTGRREEWRAEIFLHSGERLERRGVIP